MLIKFHSICENNEILRKIKYSPFKDRFVVNFQLTIIFTETLILKSMTELFITRNVNIAKENKARRLSSIKSSSGLFFDVETRKHKTELWLSFDISFYHRLGFYDVNEINRQSLRIKIANKLLNQFSSFHQTSIKLKLSLNTLFYSEAIHETHFIFS